MECMKCKKEIPDGSLYCNFCGKKQVQERKALKRANGMGTVYKRKEKLRRPWVAAKNGVVIGYFEKKTEALEALERLTGKPLSERYNMTFKEVYEGWSAEHFRTVTGSSQACYKLAFKVYAPLHDKKFRTLRTSDFQRIVDSRSDLSYASLSNYKNLVLMMSRWAMREEIITTNYATFIQLPENKKKEKPIFSDEDIAKLTADGSETAMIVLMLIYTGMRIGELFGMKLENFHGDYCIGGEKTEAGKNRIIPIRPEGRDYFKHFADTATGDLLLSGYFGNGKAWLSNFRQIKYYPLLEKLGIERKTPHSTRHTYASWARSVGMQPEVLQKILGHADYQTTANIYVHPDIATLIKAVEK